MNRVDAVWADDHNFVSPAQWRQLGAAVRQGWGGLVAVGQPGMGKDRHATRPADDANGLDRGQPAPDAHHAGSVSAAASNETHPRRRMPASMRQRAPFGQGSRPNLHTFETRPQSPGRCVDNGPTSRRAADG